MLTLSVLNHQKFTVTLQMHKIIQVFFLRISFVPSERNMLHAAIVCQCWGVYVYVTW